MVIQETPAPYQYHGRNYGKEDIEKLEEGIRAELIQGCLYMLAAPSRLHQYILTKLLFQIELHLQKHKGQYQKAGVREYWIVEPKEKKVYVYNFENPQKTKEYSFEEEIPANVLTGLKLRIKV